jgi:hypothetical protein
MCMQSNTIVSDEVVKLGLKKVLSRLRKYFT